MHAYMHANKMIRDFILGKNNGHVWFSQSYSHPGITVLPGSYLYYLLFNIVSLPDGLNSSNL